MSKTLLLQFHKILITKQTNEEWAAHEVKKKEGEKKLEQWNLQKH